MQRAGDRSHPVVLSILVPYLHASWIDGCLRAIRTSMPSTLPYEVLVLANGAEAMAHPPRTPSPEVVRFESRVNLGFGGGCNWLARHARGEFLALVNDDAEPAPGWAEAALGALHGNERAAAAGSVLLAPDGRVEEAGRVLWRDGVTAGLGAGRPPVRGDALPPVREVDTCSACGLVVRRRCWDEIGGFDERYYPAYYEDVDLALELRSRGWQILCARDSRVLHRRSASSSMLWRRFLGLRNHAAFTAKWSAQLGLFEPRPRDQPTAGEVERAAAGAARRSERLYHDHGMRNDPGDERGLPAAAAASTAAGPAGDRGALLRQELDHALAELRLKDEYIAFLLQNQPLLERALERVLADERRRVRRRELVRRLPLAGPVLTACVRSARRIVRR